MNIVLLTNILNPYRKAFYDELSKQCTQNKYSFHVLVMASGEYNREWKYDDYKGEYSILLKCKTYRIKHLPIYRNRDLKRRLRELQPDVLIMAGGYMLPSVWKACRYKKELGCKTYFWSESHLDEKRDYNSVLLKIREIIRHRFYKKFNGFWYPGEKAMALIQRYAALDAEYYQVPNLIDNRKFETELQNLQKSDMSKEKLREKYGLDIEKIVLFAPMRLNWTKGLLPFMDIVNKSTYKDKIQLAVAGTGELKEELERKASELHVNLRLLGYHEEAEIIELYKASDIFFMSSLSDPSPLSCVEAIWCGLPLFVSEHVGNYPEVVWQGENGFVYSYDDLKRAAGYLDDMIEKEKLWYDNASKVSRQIAEEKFELESMTGRLLKEMFETL